MSPSPMRHPARVAGASLLRLQSDARLAELAIAGHEAAFDAIVDRYRTPLTRYCAGIVGPSRAEDAAQQALINAHDALKRTDEVRHLKPWLYRIAHNAALNVLRAVRDDVPLEEAGSTGSLRASASAEPAESFARSEQFRETLAALQALPERQRAALVLRELEGRSHEEIAEALGVTKGSARQHLMRARVAVRSAVTAVTPYPLIARLAELIGGAGGASAGAGWVDAVSGAGASAGLVKLTAGLAATGALVGGAVGTQQLVERGDSAKAKATAAPTRTTPPAPTKSAVVVKRAEIAPGAGATGATKPPTRSSTREQPSSRSPSRSAVKRRATAHRKTPPAAATTPPTTNAGAGQPSTPEATTPSRPVAKGHGNGNGNGHTKSASDSHGTKTASKGHQKQHTPSAPKPSKAKNPKADKPQTHKTAPTADPGDSNGKSNSDPSPSANGNSSNESKSNGNGNGSNKGKSSTTEPSPTDGD